MPDRVADSDIVLNYISEGWEKLYGGKMEFVADPDEMIRRTLEHIDKKRAALGLPVYDPDALRPQRRRAHARAGRACRSPNAAPGASTAWLPTRTQTAGGTDHVSIHCNPRHPWRQCPGHRSRVMLAQGPGRKRRRTPGRFPQYGLLPAADPGHDRRRGRDTWATCAPVLEHARALLHPVPSERRWTPYLGETLDSGMATLLAAETIEAMRFVYGLQPEPMPGFQLAGGTAYYRQRRRRQRPGRPPQRPDRRHPAAFLGHPARGRPHARLRRHRRRAKSNEVAVKIVRELQQRNILTFLCGNVNGRSIIHQLQEEGVELGYDTYIVPFGTDTISAIYALGFAVRSALTFGGMKGGQARDILLYNKDRVFAFVLALGEVDDLKYAAAAGAINFGFPVIADTVIPEILPTGVTPTSTWSACPSMRSRARTTWSAPSGWCRSASRCAASRSKSPTCPCPCPTARPSKAKWCARPTCASSSAASTRAASSICTWRRWTRWSTARSRWSAPTSTRSPPRVHMDLGIVVEVAGRKMQEDFEPVLERQIHYFVNGASGIQHIGQRDIAWIRISKAAADKGFNLEHFGKILHARFHADFGAIVDKVQVTIYTDPSRSHEWLGKARAAYDYRNKRLADLTDDAVDEFYSCTLCQSFAPNHVCVVSPERLGLCGAYNWLDCKASFSINPTGPNQPIKLGKSVDTLKGYWTGTNEYACIGSHGVVQEVAMYSIMENPMTACGCFECIVMLIPEANGVMVVSREDPSMTPAGHDLLHAGRHGRRRPADARRDGRGQVLPDQPQVHLRRRRLQARRLDEQRPQGDHGRRAQSRRRARRRPRPDRQDRRRARRHHRR